MEDISKTEDSLSNATDCVNSGTNQRSVQQILDFVLSSVSNEVEVEKDVSNDASALVSDYLPPMYNPNTEVTPVLQNDSFNEIIQKKVEELAKLVAERKAQEVYLAVLEAELKEKQNEAQELNQRIEMHEMVIENFDYIEEIISKSLKKSR